jgi:tetratricopeptide (TPR) repeat protein
LAEAEADYAAAIRLSPDDMLYYRNRAEVLLLHGKHELAMKDLDKVLQKDPKDSTALYYRGLAHREAGRPERANADLSAAIAIDPTQWRYFNARGRARGNQGDWLTAIADYTDAIRLAPDEPLPYENRAKAYVSLGEFEKASHDKEKLKALQPGR